MKEMQIVYRGEDPPPGWETALFFTGPSGPASEAASPGQVAIERLREREYRGVVFVDEDAPGAEPVSSVKRAHWADRWRPRADCALLWFPTGSGADLALHLAGLGELVESGRVVLGVAEHAFDGAAELRRWAAARGLSIARTLPVTVDHALGMLPPPAWREGAERDVPLAIWHTSWFKGWHSALKDAGNALVEVRGAWMLWQGPAPRRVALWALQPKIRIGAEGRTMSTEAVIGRPDMSALMLYQPGADPEIVLVRDFRSAARSPDGYVCELPSGSGGSTDPRQNAVDEFREETSLEIDPGRLRYHGAHQVWPTGAAHVVHLYSAEATEDEIDYIRNEQRTGAPHGVHEEEEYTFPVLVSWRWVQRMEHVDWSTRGMIQRVLDSLDL